MKNFREKYKNCKVEDLLDDDFFVQSMKDTSQSNIHFWQNLIDNQQLDVDVYKEARNIIVAANYSSPPLVNESEEDQLWQVIESSMEERLVKKRRAKVKRYYLLTAAASVAAIVLVVYLLAFNNGLEVDNSYYTEMLGKVEKEEGTAKLILPDHQIILSDDANTIENTKTGDVLISDEKYSNDSQGHNHLITPYGKQTKLILEDGTTLWVNANTHVIYPTSFGKDQREIFVEGEVFLDVTHNDKIPFIVKTTNMNIEVLGTSFNVSAYKNEATESLVLVNGSVKLKYKDGKNNFIKPNEEFIGMEKGTSIRTIDVTNTVAWIKGYYRFNDESIFTVLDKLSKFYGYKMIPNENLKNIKCSGGVDLNRNMDLVIKGLANTLDIQYEKHEESKTIYFTNE